MTVECHPRSLIFVLSSNRLRQAFLISSEKRERRIQCMQGLHSVHSNMIFMITGRTCSSREIGHQTKAGRSKIIFSAFGRSISKPSEIGLRPTLLTLSVSSAFHRHQNVSP